MEGKKNGRLTDYNKPWIMQRADPYVYHHKDGCYYFTASVPEFDKLIIRKSNTLNGLKDTEEKVIWTRHESGEMGAHIWAPELHYLDGCWYLYFAAGARERVWDIRPYALVCRDADPLNGCWEEAGRIQGASFYSAAFRDFSLDATVFELKGRHYMVWAEKAGGNESSNLYIGEMESPLKLKTEPVLLSAPEYDWEKVGFWVNEGPAVLKKGEKIFLTYSASATGSCYAMGMLETQADAGILDPQAWKKERLPVLFTDREKGIFGPGHNSFFQTEDGRDIMAYHARTYEEIYGDPLHDPNRHAMLMEIKWENGRPVFDYRNQL